MAGAGSVIRAAGGVVTRPGEKGLEFLLVHRPRYEDWTFPKGKLEFGETDRECALREVAEETGLKCELQDELSPVSYRDHKGRPKQVRYWSMKAVEGEFRPNEEVDRVCWVSRDEALALLTYDHDRSMLSEIKARRA